VREWGGYAIEVLSQTQTRAEKGLRKGRGLRFKLSTTELDRMERAYHGGEAGADGPITGCAF
jgi:hypothetical protein